MFTRRSCLRQGGAFMRQFTLVIFLVFLSTHLLHAQDNCPDDALYVTPEGTGLGTKASPANLLTALARCKSDAGLHLIKVSTGTHMISQTMFIPSDVTIDGNYDVADGIWKKSTVLNCVLSVSPPGDEIETVTSDNKPTVVGHYIGIMLDTVANITLKDFVLKVHKKNNTYADMTSTLDGKSVYGIFGRGSHDIYMINLHIVTDSGGDGYYGYGGLDGASSDFNVPGVTLPDQHYYRPRPSAELEESYRFRAGGTGGTGGRVQDYYRCLVCPGTITSQTTYCAAEMPLPKGGRGGKNGGLGGESGDNCEMDCYYEFYKSKVKLAGELLDLLSLPGGSEPKDPTPDPGADGTHGTGSYNGGDYTDQTIYPYDDINYYYIPGSGVKGGDGSGGSGGGGGGAGGIRTLGMIPTIPGMGEFNLPAKALGVFNKAITLIGGDDVCNAEVVNGSTEGGPGGAGGEGGEGGGGGHGGGASIGVFMPLCKNVIDKNCVYVIGEGGRGGFGGYGGKGGHGGKGLPGRPVGDAGWSYQGATGGKGGNGGDGSRGQHGRAGRTVTKIGVTTTPLPFVMSDIATGCTNSVIALYTPGGGFLYPQGGGSNDLNVVQDKPSGSSFTAFMPDVQVVATDTGRLNVLFRSFTGNAGSVQSDVYIKTIRPLPALNVPATLCLGETLKLQSDVNSKYYSWKIYNSNEEVLYSATSKAITYAPPSVGIYTVGFQVYDVCCGFSTPQYRTVTVSTVAKPTITNRNSQIAYCYGSDSSKFELTSKVTGYDKLRWTNGSTTSPTYIKTEGWYSLTVTTPAGCSATSDSVWNYVFPLPKGEPVITDLQNICPSQEITLTPDYEAGTLYNFYFQGNSKTSGFLADGVKKQSVNVTAGFGIAGSTSYFIRKVSRGMAKGYEVNCVSDEVREVKVYRETYPPVVPGDNLERHLALGNNDCSLLYTYEFPKALDNCNPYVSVAVRRMPAGHRYPIGTTVDTLRYTDISGNFLDYPIRINVHDVTPPTIRNKPVARVELNNTAGECSASYAFTLASALDNCTTMPEFTGSIPETITNPGGGSADVMFISGYKTGNIFPVGNNVIRQTWYDASANLATFEQTIAVKDSEPPVLQCSDITYYVAKGQNAVAIGYNAPLVTDNCSAYLTSSLVSGFGQSGLHAIGTTTEVWKATDASGNIGSCSFKLTVLDTISPSIDCSNIRPAAYAAAGSDQALVTFSAPIALDNSGSAVVTTTGPGSGAYYKTGEHPLVYIATDASGNTASCVIVVSVSDIEAPTLTLPPDIKVANNPGVCGAVVNFTVANAPDNDGNTYSPYRIRGQASGAVFPLGTTQQVFKVTDANGNTATGAFNVTVTDTQAPVFTACPGDKTEFVNPAVCGKMITLSVPTATDNSCLSPSVGFVSGSAGGFFPVGVTHQVYRATDAYGNSATCAYDVTIVDNTTLAITCPANVEVNTTPGLCGAVPAILAPTANNAYGCLEWELITSKGIGDLFTAGLHTVTYRAKALGQSATCSFTVQVNDTEVPKILQPDNIVVSINDGECGKYVTFPEPVGTDNCTNVRTQRTTGLASGSLFPIGTTVQKYITFDNFNQRSISFTVTVLDNVSPSFTDLPDIQQTTADICGKTVNFPEPTAVDNSACFTITRLKGLSSGDLFPVGVTEQVYIAKDGAGNADTTRFNIVVTSNAQATFNACPPDVVVMSHNDLTEVVWYDIPGRISCAGVTSLLISGKGSGATFSTGTTVETYLIIDASGKTDTCSFRVIVLEKVAPYVGCRAPYEVELVDSICGAWVKLPLPTADDYDGSGIQTIYNDKGPNDALIFFPVGYSTIKWTAVDWSGNRSTSDCQVIVGKEDKPRNTLSSRVKACEGSNVEIYPDMEGNGPYVYEWTYYDPTTFQTVVVSTDSVFRIPAVKESDQRQYAYRVFSPCKYTVYQREFLLEVNPSPVVTLAGVDTAYCEYNLAGESLVYLPAAGLLTGAGIIDGKFYPAKAGVGTHTLSYTYHDDALGCPSTASRTVKVYAKPVVAAFIDTAYCINNSVIQLDAVKSMYAGPGISGTTFNATVANVGLHTITRTVTDHGCMSSLSKTVRIEGNVPDASILTTGPICSNKAPVALESATPGGIWTGSTVSFTNDKPYFNVKAATLGEHKVIHTLVKDVCTAVDSVMITIVDSKYDLPFTFDAYCYDQGPVLLDVSDSKSYFGFGIEHNMFNPAAYDTTTTALFGVATVNSVGCIDSVWRAMAVLKPELIDPLKLICKTGDEAVLSTDARLALVRWFDNTTGQTKSVYDTGTYIVELHNTFGCIKMDTFLVGSKQAALPSLINHTDQLFKCVDATATLAVDAAFASYVWSTGAEGNTITINSPGEYGIYVTDHEDCELYDKIIVRDYTPIANNQLTNHGTYLEAITSTSYTWFRNDVLIEGAESQTLAVMEPGNYYVSLLDNNGCVSVSDITQVILTSIDERENTKFLIYPNPGKGRFTFEFAPKRKSDLEIVFINALGQFVERLTVDHQSSQLTYSVNLEAFPSGVYWALVTEGDRTTAVKIVKID